MGETERLDWSASPDEAARYLLRKGRPRATEAEVDRAARCLIVDPSYRNEVARDARTLLTDPVVVALQILTGSDRDRAAKAAS